MTEETNCGPMTLTVVPLEEEQPFLSFFSNRAQRNADIASALQERGHTCPLPLIVDGRRFDSLANLQSHQTYTLDVVFPPASLPEFGVPPGTYPDKSQPKSLGSLFQDDSDGAGWRLIAEKRQLNWREQKQAALGVVLNLNMEGGRKKAYEESKGPSKVHWIADGVVLCKEPLIAGNSFCSLDCFLSAQDLAVDISTFKLLESPERKRRLALARRGVLSALDSFEKGDFGDIASRQRIYKVLGACSLMPLGVFMMIGSFAWAPNIFIAALMMILAIVGGGVGFYMFLTSGGWRNDRDRTVREALKLLRYRVRESCVDDEMI